MGGIKGLLTMYKLDFTTITPYTALLATYPLLILLLNKVRFTCTTTTFTIMSLKYTCKTHMLIFMNGEKLEKNPCGKGETNISNKLN